MTSMFRLQERIAALMGSGLSLDQVEQEVIDPAHISGERKAALWLYAWSVSQGSARELANAGPSRKNPAI